MRHSRSLQLIQIKIQIVIEEHAKHFKKFDETTSRHSNQRNIKRHVDSSMSSKTVLQKQKKIKYDRSLSPPPNHAENKTSNIKRANNMTSVPPNQRLKRFTIDVFIEKSVF